MPAGRDRDPRLDFFRGLAMLIIFVAHVPGNSWTAYIPARFGFSSAAEMFVFCSGFASALAFGSVFARRGWRIGTVRILHRIWQLYWAHVGLFLVLATISIVAARLHFGARDDAADLSLGVFASDGLGAIAGLMTLSLVPDLLNILPMYVVLLALRAFGDGLVEDQPFAGCRRLGRLVGPGSGDRPQSARGRRARPDMVFRPVRLATDVLYRLRLRHEMAAQAAAESSRASADCGRGGRCFGPDQLLGLHRRCPGAPLHPRLARPGRPRRHDPFGRLCAMRTSSALPMSP